METKGIDIDRDIDEILKKKDIIEQYRGEAHDIKVTIERTINEVK